MTAIPTWALGVRLALCNIVSRLDPLHQRVYRSHDLRGIPIAEIARRENLSVADIRTILMNARMKVCERLHIPPEQYYWTTH